MSAAIGFYHLTRFSLDQALPRLVQKILQAGLKALVRIGSGERMAHLDALLWTFDPGSWLPHGVADGAMADRQPVLLSAGADNPNGATVLILTDGVEPESLDGFDRVLVLFDGHDEAAVAGARRQWRQWKDGGHSLTYFQQGEQGGWVEKAKA